MARPGRDRPRAQPPVWRRARDWAFPRPGVDERIRAGRLTGLLYAAAVLAWAASAWALPQEVDQRKLALLIACALAAGIAASVAPWQRWPHWATLVPNLLGFALLGVAGAWAGALDHYAAFYSLTFLYLGLSQRPGVPTLMGAPALASVLVALAGREPHAHAVGLLGAVFIGVVLGEVLAQTTGRERRTRASVEALLEAVTLLTDAPSEDVAADRVADLAQRLLDADGCGVLLTAEPGSRRLVNRGHRGVGIEPGSIVLDLDGAPSGSAHAVRTGQTVFVEEAVGSPLLAPALVEQLRMGSALYVPIPGEGGRVGVIVCWWHQPKHEFDDMGRRITTVLSQQAGQVLERLRSVDRLELQARTDALTGLANRRSFLDALTRMQPGGAVVFLDLDHFKALNDSQGHQAGDEVLRRFAAALASVVRDGDCAARYGGEEFAVVLSGGGQEAGEAVVDRLLHRWQELGAPVSFSAGVASHQLGDAAAATLARADAALYAAKRAGRNRVVLADDSALAAAEQTRILAGS